MAVVAGAAVVDDAGDGAAVGEEVVDGAPSATGAPCTRGKEATYTECLASASWTKGLGAAYMQFAFGASYSHIVVAAVTHALVTATVLADCDRPCDAREMVPAWSCCSLQGSHEEVAPQAHTTHTKQGHRRLAYLVHSSQEHMEEDTSAYFQLLPVHPQWWVCQGLEKDMGRNKRPSEQQKATEYTS